MRENEQPEELSRKAKNTEKLATGGTEPKGEDRGKDCERNSWVSHFAKTESNMVVTFS